MTDAALKTDGPHLDEPSTAEDVRTQVIARFKATAADQERVLRPLSDDLPLLESGLDSLCFAIIVAELEDELGLDPFSELEDAYFPVTFGDFVQLYVSAAHRGD